MRTDNWKLSFEDHYSQLEIKDYRTYGRFRNALKRSFLSWLELLWSAKIALHSGI
jgi:hypothetical protein